MFLSVVIFGSDGNDGILVQLPETSNALSVEYCTKHSLLGSLVS